MGDRVEVENVNHPGRTERVDAAKYAAIRDLMLAALPQGAPGLTGAQIKDALRPDLPQDLFPGGATLGWWAKSVQLDLEAKGLVQRAPTRPLTFFRPT
ncbi:DUF6958 family protein [Pseudoponticoccus marisrubri]|uniref:Uncharacterized protein n=1 Tax=Pseudoponticoccus marisrubri TaxID=1685382 RepID=A0A0W7WQI1_9RHOB|nr:hypothetical protein [Pseudoponticoccus marisrubri]KUF12775.1 hypothetical protein AVJ23_03435 [Pseudoponticoccus marisrubri]